MAEAEAWTFRLLGGFEAACGEQVLPPLSTHKATATLAFLALHLGQPIPRTRLIELFWPGGHPETGRNSLSAALAAIRRANRTMSPPAELPLLADTQSVKLDAHRCVTDVERFETALEDARTARPPERPAALRRALARYAGPLLPHLKYDWNPPERAALHQRYFAAADELISLLEEEGESAEALDLARTILPHEPLRETTHLHILRLLAARSQVQDALVHLERYREELERAQVPVSPALLRVAAALRSGRPPTDLASADTRATPAAGLLVAVAADSATRAELSRQPGALMTIRGDAPPPAVIYGCLSDALTAVRTVLVECRQEAPPAMAIATGDALRPSDQQQLMIVGRAAAIYSAALPGQVLCDAPTAALISCEQSWVAHAPVLGERVISNHGQLMQLAVVWFPDLSEAPITELASTARPVGSLAAPHSALIGRTGVVGKLVKRLSEPDCRLISLIGPAGVGKGRVALAAARRRVRPTGGRVWLVSLRSVSSAEGIGPQLLHTMGRGWSGGDPILDLRQALLHSEECLVVLDDLEHLLPAAASVIQRLLATVKRLKLLVTSRVPCRIAAEEVWTIEPLPLPEPGDVLANQRRNPCVVLFCESARRIDPAFELSDRNLADVVAICRQLDGLPLALELAANAAIKWGLSSLAEQLHDGFDVLDSDDPEQPAAQRSLRTAFEWSYSLLTDEEQACCRATSLFEGSFDTVTMAAVAGQAAADCLPGLAGKSLLTIEAGATGTSYRCLSTVRAYAAECLEESNEADALRRRFVEHYARGASDDRWQRTDRPAHELGWLAPPWDLTNRLTAVRYAAARSWWPELGQLIRGHLEPMLRHDLALGAALREPLLAGLTAATDHAGLHWTATVAGGLMAACRWTGDHATALEAAPAAVRAARSARADLDEIYCATSAMISAYTLHRRPEARHWADYLLGLRTTSSHPGRALLAIAIWHEHEGRFAEALAATNEASYQPDTLCSPSQQRLLLERYCLIHSELNRPHEAAEVARHALRMLVHQVEPDAWVGSLVRLLAIAPLCWIGEVETARHHARQAAGILQRSAESLRGFYGVRLVEQCLIGEQPVLALDLGRQLFTGWVDEMIRPDTRHLSLRVAAELWARNHFHHEAAQALRRYAAEPVPWDTEPLAFGEGLRVAGVLLAELGRHAAAQQALQTAAAALSNWPRRQASCLASLRAIAPEAEARPKAEGAEAAWQAALDALAL